MDFTREFMFDILSKREGGEDIESVESVEVLPCVAQHQNFLSQVIRVKIDVKLKSGEEKSHSVVVKKGERGDKSTGFEIDERLFIAEAKAYKFLEAMSDWAKKNNYKIEKLWAECLFSSIEDSPYIIMLQDLSELDYRMYKKRGVLDAEHVYISVQCLARVHAMSRIFMIKEKPDIDLNVENDMTVFANFFKQGLNNLQKAVTKYNKNWQYIANFIEEIAETPMTRFVAARTSVKNDFTCLSFGDVWTNNILYSYSTKDNTVNNARFIDFQFAQYNSFAWDLNFLLHLSLLPKYRLENMENLLRKYQQVFLQTISDLGGDPELAPSYEQMISIMDKLLIPAFFYSSVGAVDLISATDDDYKKLAETGMYSKLEWYLKNAVENGFIENIEYFEKKGIFKKK